MHRSMALLMLHSEAAGIIVTLNSLNYWCLTNSHMATLSTSVHTCTYPRMPCWRALMLQIKMITHSISISELSLTNTNCQTCPYGLQYRRKSHHTNKRQHCLQPLSYVRASPITFCLSLRAASVQEKTVLRTQLSKLQLWLKLTPQLAHFHMQPQLHVAQRKQTPVLSYHHPKSGRNSST